MTMFAALSNTLLLTSELPCLDLKLTSRHDYSLDLNLVKHCGENRCSESFWISLSFPTDECIFKECYSRGMRGYRNEGTIV